MPIQADDQPSNQDDVPTRRMRVRAREWAAEKLKHLLDRRAAREIRLMDWIGIVGSIVGIAALVFIAGHLGTHGSSASTPQRGSAISAANAIAVPALLVVGIGLALWKWTLFYLYALFFTAEAALLLTGEISRTARSEFFLRFVVAAAVSWFFLVFMLRRQNRFARNGINTWDKQREETKESELQQPVRKFNISMLVFLVISYFHLASKGDVGKTLLDAATIVLAIELWAIAPELLREWRAT